MKQKISPNIKEKLVQINENVEKEFSSNLTKSIQNGTDIKNNIYRKN